MEMDSFSLPEIWIFCSRLLSVPVMCIRDTEEPPDKDGLTLVHLTVETTKIQIHGQQLLKLEAKVLTKYLSNTQHVN